MEGDEGVGFNIPGILSKLVPRTALVTVGQVDFTPIRIDAGESGSVIAGTRGELAVLDSDGSSLGERKIPFPAPTIDGLVLEDRWIGIWLDREFRQARMAALPLGENWSEGESREHLRLSIGSGGEDVVPTNSIWHRVMDSEPMKIGGCGGNVVFATISGIYMIDPGANEIWRTQLPRWPSISSLGLFDNVVSINEFSDGLAVWSQAGGVSVLDPNNGMEIYNRVLELGDKVCNAEYSKEAGWIVMLHGGDIVVMGGIEGEHTTHRTTGPVMDSKFIDGRWVWTGWRHDGALCDGEVLSSPRGNIGVAVLDGMVLANDGTWSQWSAPNLT